MFFLKQSMNLQSFSNAMAQYHGMKYADVSDETIVFKLDDTIFSKNTVLKLSDSEKTVNVPKPIVYGLLAFFNIETPWTIFYVDESWALLLGNKKCVFPSHNGKTLYCCTPYFVKEPKVLQHMFPVSYHENCYRLKNTIVFLDQYDIPYPGGDYFESTPNDLYRICYVTLQTDGSVENFFKDKKGVYKSPLKTKPALATLSPFTQISILNNINFPDTYYESTNIVLKRHCFQDPAGILQDILDSFPSKEVGIVIEYPIRISFVALDQEQKSGTWLAFAVNTHAPKQVLYVPSPYDRYYQYRYPPPNIPWIPIYADDKVPELKPVILCKYVIGYVYKDTFFCLLYPKWTTTRTNKNLNFLFNVLSFDIQNDPDWKVVHTYRFDTNHVLLCVKHKNLYHEMWCMKEDATSTVTRSRSIPSHLVREWGELLLGHDKNIPPVNITFVKFMSILDRHNICYFIRETNRERRIEYKDKTDIVFHLEPTLFHFMNGVRQNKSEEERREEENGCIMS